MGNIKSNSWDGDNHSPQSFVSEIPKAKTSKSIKNTKKINTSKTWSRHHAKRMGALLASTLLAGLSHLPAFAGDNILPTGGQVSAGSATISTQNNAMHINQSSQRAAINWSTFSVGKDASVNFNQPNTSAITLNRVVGNEQSVINGAINANGQVYLLNSQGILFNKGSQVNVGGLVAATHELSDADFMAGKTTFSTTNGKGSVINLGTITAKEGGYVALLGNQVSNEGVISANLGSVVMAAGDKISLNFNGDSLLGVTIDKGSLNAMVRNREAIFADGGKVILTAKGVDKALAGVVNNTGTIQARTISKNKKGEIYLLGGLENDQVEVAGTLDASAPHGGDGGFIESSAAKVRVAASAKITTKSAQGKTGTYLIDPTNFTISSGTGAQTESGMGADTLSATLNGTNFIIQTQAAGTEAGDINVDANVMWEQNKLTLEAHGDINVNAVMSPVGTSTLDMKTGYNFNVESPTYGPTKMVRMKIDTSTPTTPVFVGKIDFNGRTGTGALAINGEDYTLISSLGSAGSTSGTDLQGMSGVLDGKFALSSDIDASTTSTWNSGAGFSPIGAQQPFYNFTGKFNGLGRVVSGLTINRTTTANVGLFGFSNGLISNTAVVDASVRGKYLVGILVGEGYNIANSYTTGSVIGTPGNAPNGYNIGGLVGYFHNGIISNSYSTATVTGVRAVGGLVGIVFGGTPSIYNSYALGNVTGNGDSVGGLIGSIFQTTVSNSYATGSVNGGGGNGVGGLIGVIDTSTVTNSYATGNITGTGDNIGGLVGRAGCYGCSPSHVIDNSHATGTVTGSTASSDSVGGLVGFSYNLTVTSSYATGNVNGGGWAIGGLIGDLEGASSITGSAALGTVIGGNNVGGLVGEGETGSSIANSYATGDVTGSGDSIGGLVGEFYGTSINQSYATGTVIGVNKVGGLVGYASDTTMSNVYSTGAAEGLDNVGGIAGKSSNLIINNSYATGDITGTGRNIGGFIGELRASTVERSYSTSNVFGGNYVGGFVGYAVAGSTIRNAYSQGSVTGNDNVGGFAGKLDDTGGANTINTSYSTGSITTEALTVGGFVAVKSSTDVITNSFWDVTTSGIGTSRSTAGSAGGEGRTTAEMQGNAIYGNANWDTGSPSAGAQYPTLRFVDGQPVWRVYGSPGVLTLNLSSISMVYGDSLPSLSGFTVTGCNACVSVNWGSAINSSTNAGRYDYTNTSNIFSFTWANGYSAADYIINLPTGALTITALSRNSVDETALSRNSVDEAVKTSPIYENIITQALVLPRVLLPSVTLVTAGSNQIFGGRAGSMAPNVSTSMPVMSASFGADTPLALVSAPDGVEPTQGVSLSESRKMLRGVPNGGTTSNGERDVRVPVARNSLAEIVNGGVKLPGGVEQQLFVVKAAQ